MPDRRIRSTFFADAPGDRTSGVQAHIYLGTETFIGGTTGNVTFTSLASPLTSSQSVTATATLLTGSTFTDTSAFSSPAVVVTEFSEFIVTTTAATGAGSLEQAILNANADTSDPSAYVILFGIATGNAPYTINPLAAGLTPITHPVVLDATSQPGYAGSPIIVLDGTGVTTSGLILATGSDGSAIRGFDIIDFTTVGTAGIEIDSGGNVVQANYVGVQTDGMSLGQNIEGVLVQGANNTIGGTTPGTGNVISSNINGGILITGAGSSANVVAGNLIGTDSTGTVEVGNGGDGVEVEGAASSNTIGGATPGAGNVISLSLNDGIELSGVGTSDNVVAGNLIGTDLTGTIDFPNSENGVEIDQGASGNTIGGTTALARNILSGNGAQGVKIDSAATGNAVAGNYIGTDITGTVALPNTYGVDVESSGNTIGGTVAGAGNLISGNNQGDGVYIRSSNDLVAGNQIGTDVTGTVALPDEDGVEVNGSGNTIGGTVTGAGNLISGNTEEGILIEEGGNLVAGNLIGTDITGTLALANHFGVFVEGPSNTIGGSTAVAANLISGNTLDGIEIFNVSTNLVEGNLIGTDSCGTVAVDNGVDGVQIDFGASDYTNGGTASGTLNVISGNTSDGVEIIGAGTTGNVVAGNLIGTDITGTVAIGNGIGGVSIVSSSDNLIGGTAAGAGNVISGNQRNGLSIGGPGANDNLVQGNWIGTNATEAETIPNGDRGVQIEKDAASNTIGGSIVAARNVISDNNGDGVVLGGGIQNVVEGNYIGVNDSGTTTAGNARYGVFVLEADRTSNSVPSSARTTSGSGLSSGSRGGESNAVVGNVISGNSRGGIYVAGGILDIFSGNLIGTDATGTIAIGNGFAGDGIQLTGDASANTIGGTAPGSGNVIIANSGDGDGVDVEDPATGNVIAGNRIGTSAAGTAVLGETSVGILIDSIGNTVGGTAAGAGNLISGTDTGISVNNAETLIEGNLIGTDVTGTIALGNRIGVLIESADNTLGGSTAGAGNVISANTQYGVEIEFSVATGNLVEGNLVGTDKTGTVALGNVYGVLITNTTANTIGGTTAGAGNVISGNAVDGLNISVSSEIVVAGNVIGLNAAGSAALGNSDDGIWLSLVTDSTIGGTTAASRNIISGNLHYGVEFTNAGDTGNVVEGNFIGTDVTGSTASDKSGNPLGDQTGIYVRGVTYITIGGTTPGSGNLISGNIQYGVELFGTALALIQGNEIGTAASGMTAFDSNGMPLGNGVGVVLTDDASDNFVGGSSPADRNIISGNLGVGVSVGGDENYIQETSSAVIVRAQRQSTQTASRWATVMAAWRSSFPAITRSAGSPARPGPAPAM